MKKISVLAAVLFSGYLAIGLSAAEDKVSMDHSMHSLHIMDNRISLELSPEMKQHQLSNMRSHVAAVQSIVGLIAAGDFDQASRVAHAGLGLTDEMKKMCTTMSNNKEFTNLGLAFHKSGDDLGNVLKTGNTKKSLRALQDTMGYCVQCHATFRQ